MTILTKSVQAKDAEEKKTAEAAYVFENFGGTGTNVGTADPDDLTAPRPPLITSSTAANVVYPPPPPSFDLYLVQRRRRLLSTLCVGLLLIWLVMATLVASVLLYRYMARRHTVTGFCGTDLLDDQRNQVHFQQRMEADPVYNYEKVEVPKFGRNRPAVFVHDFRTKITAIVDSLGEQCFLKPLDPNILPPKNMTDLLLKMRDGYYEQNTTMVAERYRADPTPATPQELSRLNSWMIQEECSMYRVYSLNKVHVPTPHHGSLVDAADFVSKLRRRRRRAVKRAADAACAGAESFDFVELEPKRSMKYTSISIC